MRENWNIDLRREREILGVSQKELAAAISKRQSEISSWERGEHAPSPKNREKLAAFFGKTVEELFF